MSDATYSAQRTRSATFGEHVSQWIDLGWPQAALLPGEPRTKRVGRWKAREKQWVGMTGSGLLKEGLAASDPAVTWEQIQAWPTDTICVRGSLYPALDIDAEHQIINHAVMNAVERWLDSGPLQWRGRKGSHRILTPFEAFTPGSIRDWIIKFRVPGHTSPDGRPYIVELKGAGRQWLGSGLHPDGSRYEWIQGTTPIDAPDAELGMPGIDMARAERLRSLVLGVLEKHGCEIIETPPGPKGGTSLDRVDTRDLDPMVSLEALERALKATPIGEDTVGGYDQSIAIVAALRFILGREGVELPECVRQWCIKGFGDDTWIEAKWHTLDEVEPEPAAFMRYLDLHCLDREAYQVVQLARNARKAVEEIELFAAPVDPEMLEERPHPGPARPGEAAAPAELEGELDRLRRQVAYLWPSKEWVILPRCERVDEPAFNKSPIGREITRLDFAMQQGERPRPRKAADVMLGEGDLINIERITYLPGAAVWMNTKESGMLKPAFNLYRPLALPDRIVTDEDVRPFLRLSGWVYPRAEDCTLMLDWGSFIAQNPGVKVQWAPVLFSRMQGVGKDTWLNVIKHGVVGEWNFAAIDSRRIESEFNADWMPSQVTLMTELPSSHRRSVYDGLKDYVSSGAGNLSVNPKGLARYSMPNIHCWVFTTNKDDALQLETNDRRFVIVHAREERMPEDLAKEFYAWANAGGWELAGLWLKQRKISAAFDHTRCPQANEAKQDMMRAAVSPEMERLVAYFTEGGGAERTAINLQEAIMRGDGHGRLMRRQDVVRSLELAGFELPRNRDEKRRIAVGKGKAQVWVRGGNLVSATHRVIAERLLAEEEDQAPELAKATRANLDAAKPKAVVSEDTW